MSINWDDPNWGGNVHESETGSDMPEKNLKECEE